MNRAEISSKVIKICKQVSYDETLQIFEANHLHNDIGFDSLDIIDIANNIEKEFKIIVTDKEISKLNTVGDIVDLVYSRL